MRWGMWPRILEIAIGMLVAAGPLVLSGTDRDAGLAIAAGCLTAVVSAAGLSSGALGNVRWAVLFIAALLTGGALSAGTLSPQYRQLFAAAGLMLMMTGILPTGVSNPPRGWERYYLPNPTTGKRGAVK